MSVIDQIQQSIQSAYDLDLPLKVADYLVDEETRQSICGAQTQLPEQFFIREDGEHLEFALFIHNDILKRLENDDPFLRLHAGNFSDFCVALEGVSHLLLTANRANQNRSISALEMELQAEVDKFVHAWLLLDQQGQQKHSTAKRLLSYLFTDFTLHDGLSNQEQERYHVASINAERYCRKLTKDYQHDRNTRRIRTHTRNFFQQPLAEKLSMVATPLI